MKIGNHCVLFGPRLQTEMEFIVKGLAAGGCDGMEMGKRFLASDQSKQILDLLNENGVELSAYHVNGPLTAFLDAPEMMKGQFREAVEFLKDFPCKNVLYTSLVAMPGGPHDTLEYEFWDPRLTDKESLTKIAEVIEEIAVEMKEAGVQLHLHNHDWEFVNNALIFETLLDNAPHLNAGLDIGWAYIEGYDAAEIIKKYADQITYVHLRDMDLSKVGTFANWFERHDHGFVDLGEGNVPFDTLLPLIAETVGENGWATVEYESGPQDFERYHKATEFVKNILNKED